MSTKAGRERTYYSQQVKGDGGNYDWPVRFNVTDGYVGISQWKTGPPFSGVSESVLLSPAQVKALRAFLRSHR